MLYLVATPIGNLKEITYRAVEILQEVDYIACEDTRTSKILLDYYNISKPLVAYHKFNESKASEQIISDLKLGKNIALISDAGTPGISDPGNILVNKLKENELEYTVVSGASAVINAFVLSGYQTPFTFVGFLPDNNKKRIELLDDLNKSKTTLVFYCSPHSIDKDLEDMYKILGNRDICVIREISKKFEEITHTTFSQGYTGIVKGEFVVLVKASEKIATTVDIDKDMQTLLEMGLSKTEASKVIAKLHNLKKSDLYKNLVSK